MPALNHIHTYERVGPPSENPRYRCIDPDCRSFDTKVMLLGKRAKCECGTTFILEPYCMRLKRPKCAKCSKGRRREKWLEKQRTRNVIEDITKGGPLL